MPNQVLVKEDEEYGEEIDFFDHFDTGDSDDIIAGHFKKIDYQKGTISIVGELNEEQIVNLIKAEGLPSRARIPSIDDVNQRIAVLNDTWDIELEIDELIELKEELEEAPVPHIHLTSFAVLFEGFFGYNKAKSMDELHQLIKHKIYNGSWYLFKENWSESLGLYDQLVDGIKTFEEAYKIVDNELNEDNSFNTNHPNYDKFMVFSYLKKSFGNQVVTEFLNSKKP
jgi:hypothetical protein